MRIALIDPSLFTWPYDAALAQALTSAGHEVAIFGKPQAAAGSGPAHALLREHFYRELDSAYAQRLPREVFLGVKGLSHVRDMYRLLSALREFRPDVIHVQWSPLPIVDRWFVAALRRTAPVVLTVHDAVPYNGNPRSRLQSMSAGSILMSFDRLIVHTQATAQRLRDELRSERVRCVPHGPLGDALPAVTERASKPDGTVSILLFGQIKPYKGVDLLLRALAAMPAEVRSRCRLRVVGKPLMDIAPLQQLISELNLAQYAQIEPRFVPEHEVGPLLASADIITMPYRHIEASGVLTMALGMGVPIVATRVGLFAEILEDGKHGRVIEVDDHLGLARALEELVMNDGLRAKMGAAARQLRDEIPSWAQIAELTTHVYAELVPVVGQTRPASRPETDNGREHAGARENIC